MTRESVIDRLLARAEAAAGTSITRIGIADARGDLLSAAYTDATGHGRAILLDAASGAVVSTREDEPASPLSGSASRWIYTLHEALLMGDRGETLVGVSGLLLLTATITGLWLGWPRRKKWRAVFAARRWRTAAVLATAVCASYVGVVAVGAVAGPVGPTSSPTLLPAPTTAPPAPVATPGPAAQNVAEVEPTATSTTTRSARATTRSTPRSVTPKAPRTTPRAVVVAPVPVVPQAPARVNPAPVADTQNVPNAQNDDADAANDAGADT